MSNHFIRNSLFLDPIFFFRKIKVYKDINGINGKRLPILQLRIKIGPTILKKTKQSLNTTYAEWFYAPIKGNKVY